MCLDIALHRFKEKTKQVAVFSCGGKAPITSFTAVG